MLDTDVVEAVLEVHICDQRRSYRATFATEDTAVAFIERHSRNHAFHGEAVPAGWLRLEETLDPTCEHGMSQSSCYGPDHFMSAAQEQAMGWDYADAPSGF